MVFGTFSKGSTSLKIEKTRECESALSCAIVCIQPDFYVLTCLMFVILLLLFRCAYIPLYSAYYFVMVKFDLVTFRNNASNIFTMCFGKKNPQSCVSFTDSFPRWPCEPVAASDNLKFLEKYKHDGLPKGSNDFPQYWDFEMKPTLINQRRFISEVIFRIPHLCEVVCDTLYQIYYLLKGKYSRCSNVQTSWRCTGSRTSEQGSRSSKGIHNKKSN